MPKLRVTLETGFHQGNREDIIDIDPDEWAACITGHERQALINDYWQEWANNYINGVAEIIEDEEEEEEWVYDASKDYDSLQFDVADRDEPIDGADEIIEEKRDRSYGDCDCFGGGGTWHEDDVGGI